MRSGQPGRFSFSRRAHLLTTCKAGGGIPPCGQARALFTNCLSAISPEGAGNAASGHSLCSRLYVLSNQQNDGVAYCHLIPPSACENQPPAALLQIWTASRRPFSFCEKETKNRERKDGENEWRFTTWKQK